MKLVSNNIKMKWVSLNRKTKLSTVVVNASSSRTFSNRQQKFWDAELISTLV